MRLLQREKDDIKKVPDRITEQSHNPAALDWKVKYAEQQPIYSNKRLLSSRERFFERDGKCDY